MQQALDRPRHIDNSPNSQLMPVAVPQWRGYVHGLRAVGARMHQFDAVRAGELQGQVCILLASGSKAEHCPLGQPLKPEINRLMSLCICCLTWLYKTAVCVNKSLGFGLRCNLNVLLAGWFVKNTKRKQSSEYQHIRFQIHFNIILPSNLGLTIGVLPCHHSMARPRTRMQETVCSYGG
jgi:hypothetical protein